MHPVHVQMQRFPSVVLSVTLPFYKLLGAHVGVGSQGSLNFIFEIPVIAQEGAVVLPDSYPGSC